LQDGFRMECRIIPLDTDKIGRFAKELEKQIKKVTSFNKITIQMSTNKREMTGLIKNRSFSYESSNHIFSKDEILTLFSKEKVKQEHHETIGTTTKNEIEIEEQEQVSAILPVSQINKDDVEIDNKTLEQVSNAFKRVGITNKKLKITDVFNGATLYKLTIEIPTGVNFNDIKKNLENIKASMRNENISLDIGSSPNTINFYIPRSDRRLIYLGDIMETEEYKKFAKENVLPFVIGESYTGKNKFACLSQ